MGGVAPDEPTVPRRAPRSRIVVGTLVGQRSHAFTITRIGVTSRDTWLAVSERNIAISPEGGLHTGGNETAERRLNEPQGGADTRATGAGASTPAPAAASAPADT